MFPATFTATERRQRDKADRRAPRRRGALRGGGAGLRATGPGRPGPARRLLPHDLRCAQRLRNPRAPSIRLHKGLGDLISPSGLRNFKRDAAVLVMGTNNGLTCGRVMTLS